MKANGNKPVEKTGLMKKRSFKYGTAATAMTALILAVLIIVNVISSILVERFPLKLDLTNEKAFQLTEESNKIIDTVKTPIAITVLYNEADFIALDEYAAQANEMFKNYAKRNSNIIVTYEDAVKNPGTLTKYSDISAAVGDVVVETDTRQIKVKFQDLFNFNTSSSGQQTIASSNAEKRITSAILSVMSDNQPVVSFLSGHNEQELPGLEDLLKTNNFSVEKNTIALSGLNMDSSIVVISAPEKDYTAEELKDLDTYLYNGGEYGKVVLYYGNSLVGALPKLQQFLADWGIVVGDGTVFETDSANLLSNNAYLAKINYSDTDYAGSLANNTTLFPIINSSANLSEGALSAGNNITVKELLKFSAGSAIRPSDATDSWNPSSAERKERPAGLLGMSTAIKNGQYAIHSYVVAFGSHSFVDSTYLSNPTFSNSEYTLQLINKLLGREDQLGIFAKSLSSSYLDMTAQQSNIIWILFAFVLPAMILVYGVYVFIRRRHL